MPVTSTRPANLQVNPDRKDPYSNQYIVQVEHELMTNLGLQVNYVRKDGHDYTGWQDIAGQYQQVTYIDSAGIDATNQPGNRSRIEAITDILWALVNTREFILNH